MKTKEELLDWLRDAYAMEKALAIAMKKQSENEKAPIALREVVAKHLTDTEHHADLVEKCLHDLGSDTSTLKSAGAEFMEWMKGLATKADRDEVVKDMLNGYAAEYFEIACYNALKVAGQNLGLLEVVEMAEAILKDEYQMADWLDAHIPETIRDYLNDELDTLPGTAGDPNAEDYGPEISPSGP